MPSLNFFCQSRKNYSNDRVDFKRVRSSLVACNILKTQASGAFNYRRFRECTVHLQHKCGVEACSAPTLKKKCQIGNNYNNNEDNVNGVQRAEGMRQGKPAGLQMLF